MTEWGTGGEAFCNFAAFILTHGRPDRVPTYDTMRRCGYTGPIVLLVDDEDASRDQYIQNFGADVHIFSRSDAITQTLDWGNNFESYRGVILPRNHAFAVARSLGYQYFIQLDDDYTHFEYRFDSGMRYATGRPVHRMDDVLFSMLRFFHENQRITTIAFAQGGDFIGGRHSRFGQVVTLLRKCMNSFICDTERRFGFVGQINEDVNTYVSRGGMGQLFLTANQISLSQVTTQASAGGMTDLYLTSGTYIKSFYSVMYAPSCVKIADMGDKHRRLHHRVSWGNAVPKILDECWRKHG